MVPFPEGEGTKWECRNKLCLFLLKDKEQLLSTGYKKVEGRVGYGEGTTSCWAADWGKKWVCGSNTLKYLYTSMET